MTLTLGDFRGYAMGTACVAVSYTVGLGSPVWHSVVNIMQLKLCLNSLQFCV